MALGFRASTQRVKHFVFILLFLTSFLSLLPAAADAFTIQAIRFQGLEKVRKSTVMSYLPIHAGKPYTAKQGDAAIRALYQTGFFKYVSLGRQGSTLIVTVVERPTIGLINITGNDEIKRKDLDPILKKMGIAVGSPFDASKVQQIKVGLEQQYGTMGYQDVSVVVRVKNTPHNTVALYLKVNEGVVTKVAAINFEGNHVFSSSKLRDQFTLTTPGIFTWINKHDRFSDIKLDQDLGQLTNFYLNRGYLHFSVLNHSVRYSEDRKRVWITITVSEGPQFHVGKVALTGQTLNYYDALLKKIKLRSGDVASRQAILDTDKAIEMYLGNRGYALSHVAVQTGERGQLVDLTFKVFSGGRVYVRRINIYGNQQTDERVYRRELRQMEGAVYSGGNVKESTHRLKMLPYIDPYTLKMDMSPVPNRPDQVDLNYHIKEKPAGKAMINAGYSDAYGFLYGAGITQPNFLGTGNAVSVGFQNSQVLQNYNVNFFNPYFTTNGVSLDVNAYYNAAKFRPKFNQQSYYMNSLGLDLNFGLPLTENSTWLIGAGYENAEISHVNPAIVAPSTLSYLGGRNNGDFNIYKVTSGLVFNNLDQVVFPTEGISERLNAEVGIHLSKSSPSYYKIDNQFSAYLPLGRSGFVVRFVNLVGYGNGYGSDDRLPFFLNYYAGGLQGGVPAYSPNSLGPKNSRDSNASLGGNFVMTGGVHFILPNFFNNSVRVAATLDAGNVFQMGRYREDIAPGSGVVDDDKFGLDKLRLSAGVLVTWNNQFLPFTVGLAFPISRPKGNNDELQAFQFTIGTGI